MVLRDGKLWVAPLTGGPRKEFWQPATATNASFSFSPDGSKLGFADTNGTDLWVLPYPSGKPRKLYTGKIDIRSVGWFPDSRSLLIAESRINRTSALIQIGITDGSRRIIYSAGTYLDQPAVSPDGKRIAYISADLESDVVELLFRRGRAHISRRRGIQCLSGLGTIRHAFPVLRDRRPGTRRRGSGRVWRRIFAAPDRHWQPRAGALVDRWDTIRLPDHGAADKLMLANSSGSQTILLDQATRLYGPAWSPDGQWVCYLRSAQGALKLAKIRASAGTEAVMFGDKECAGFPEWSPAGDWILCARAAGGLDLISPDGKSKRMLTSRLFYVYDFSRTATLCSEREDRGGEGCHRGGFSAVVWRRLPGIQHPSGRKARSRIHRQVSVSDLDAGGVQAATEELACTAAAALSETYPNRTLY